MIRERLRPFGVGPDRKVGGMMTADRTQNAELRPAHILARRLRRDPVRRLQRRLVLPRRPVGDAHQGNDRRRQSRRGHGRMRQSGRARLSVPARRLLRSRRLRQRGRGRRPDRRKFAHGRADLRSDALHRRTRRPGDGRHATQRLAQARLGQAARQRPLGEPAAGARIGRRRRRRGDHRDGRAARHHRRLRGAYAPERAGPRPREQLRGPGARPGAARRPHIAGPCPASPT